jgi:uncharacterized protein
MGALKSLLVFVLFGYVALVGLMYVFQRGLMYFPDPVRTAPAAAGFPEAQEVVLDTADGEKIVTWYRPAQVDKPVIVYFHGNGGALRLRVDRFRTLTADGTGLLAVSYRGYGGSSGRPTEAGIRQDAAAAYAYVAARYPPERIVLFGESLGTGVVIPLAAENPVAGVILDAPFTSAVDIAATVYPFIPVRWLMRDQFRADIYAARVRAPVLILHGERDNVVPIRFGERLFAMLTAPKEMVRFKTGNHVDLDSHGASEAVRRFLSSAARTGAP